MHSFFDHFFLQIFDHFMSSKCWNWSLSFEAQNFYSDNSVICGAVFLRIPSPTLLCKGFWVAQNKSELHKSSKTFLWPFSFCLPKLKQVHANTNTVLDFGFLNLHFFNFLTCNIRFFLNMYIDIKNGKEKIRYTKYTVELFII